MNRVDRLFAILLMLQHKRHVRAQDLAQAFEVSERTIYRDMEALCETGVPVLGTPGEGYMLMQGYFLPPLLFTPAEAMAMFLGARMMIGFTTGKVATDAERALSKIAVVLPEVTRAEVERLADIIRFYPSGARFDLYETNLSIFQQAIRERRVVHLRYHSFSQDETTDRSFEPDRMYYINGQWYVHGFCRLRGDFRSFRINRMEAINLTDEHFELKPLQIEQPTPSSLLTPPAPIRVRMTGSIVRWVHERQHYSFECEVPVPGSDDMIMTYRGPALNEFLPWLLSWGANAIPLEPPEFCTAVRDEAQAMLDHLN